MVRFKFNDQKLTALLQLFCRQFDDVDKLKAVKLLYYIDKQCLLKTGRPVLGDTYYKMNLGPVPSIAYDVIKAIPYSDTSEGEFFYESLSGGGYPKIRARNKPNLDVFSEKERECIDYVLENYGKFSGDKLSRLSHEDATWKKSENKSPIDYRLFFEGERGKDAFEAMLFEQEEDEFLDSF